MRSQPNLGPRNIAAWAAGLSLALTGLPGGAVQAQNTAPPPAPRLPSPPPLPMFGAPGYGGQQARDCGSADWTCRVERLERRVADLERDADRGDRGGGRRGQSVDTTVDRDCIFDSCSAMAVKLCAEAGFSRGVPAEVRQNGSWQRLVRATCLD